MNAKKFYKKITWFVSIFSLLVIWVHAYNAELYLGKTKAMTVVYKLEHLIGDGIGQIAVPGFFMISAYLFYRNFEWEHLWLKWKSRIYSILIPYFLWNFIYYLGYVIGSRLPWMTDVIGKGVIPFRWSVALDAVIGYTYNYVFWYLAQLIVLILLTPLIFVVMKDTIFGIQFQLIFWVLVSRGASFPGLNFDALAYYCIGAYAAIHAKKYVEGEWNEKRGYLGVILLVVSVPLYLWGVKAGAPLYLALCRVLAVSGLWLVVPEQCLEVPKPWMDYNFFLYATHFMFVRFINKAGTYILPAVPIVPLLLYLIMPVLVITISTALAKVLRLKTPKVWDVLVGGRV